MRNFTGRSPTSAAWFGSHGAQQGGSDGQRNRFETPRRGREALAAYNIPVNAVTPAAAKTEIFEQITQAHIDYMLAKIPRNRFVRVEEVAARVAG